MKPNPNNIEEQLKAAAAKRREAQGGPFALGPVERSALLREVGAKWPPASTQKKAAWWDVFSGRLAWASSLAAFAFLVAGVLVRTGSRQEGTLVSSQPAARAPEAVLRDATPPQATASASTQDRFEKVQEGLLAEKEIEAVRPETRSFGIDRGRAADAIVAPSPKAESPAPSELSLSKRAASRPDGSKTATGAAAGPSVAAEQKNLRMAEPKAEAPVARTATLASAANNVDVSMAARFYSFRDTSQNSLYFRRYASTELPVLANFSLERRGETVLLRDADGSIYQGTTATRERLARDTTQLRESDAGTNVTFTASGTNLTLGRLVQVRGVINQSAELTAPARGVNTATNRAQRLKATVQIQGRNPVSIDAVSDGQTTQPPAASTPPPASPAPSNPR